MDNNVKNNGGVSITVTCASGSEKVVKSELERLGYPSAPAINGAITFNADMLDELYGLLVKADEDRDVLVVVINSGCAKAFSVGGDIKKEVEIWFTFIYQIRNHKTETILGIIDNKHIAII